METKIKIAMLTVSLLSITSISAICQEYIVMGTPFVNIRTGPGTDSYIIAWASKGDVFKVVRKQSGWYEIVMFTGERRYVVEADFVYQLTVADIKKRPDMDLPSENRCKSLYKSILMAKKRAAKEADEIIPYSEDRDRNTIFRKIKEDQIILEVMINSGIQPLLYQDLINRATANNW